MRKKSKQIIKIPEWIAIDSLKRHIDGSDSDELARLLGDIFGGECNQDVEAEIYNFKPNKFYAGEFDDIEEKNELSYSQEDYQEQR